MTKTGPIYYQILAPHFVAGLKTENGIITLAAPIIKWTIGWKLALVLAYFIHEDYEVKKI